MRLNARHHASMLVLALTAPAAFAQAHARGTPPGGALGDHPAVVVQRLQRSAGYDYASKFYPHPARLYLLRAAPDELERMQRAAQAALNDSLPDEPESDRLARR